MYLLRLRNVIATQLQFLMFRRNQSMKSSEIYRHCFAILEVPEVSSQDTVREAYIKLVKKYHPDSGKPEASAEKFQEIDNAFRILQEKFAKNRRGIDDDQHNIDEAKVFDIRHTAPQHRQYLSFDGIGYGTPFQRERQYRQARAMKAQERVLEHRVQQSQAGENAVLEKSSGYYKTHAIKTKYGLDRVVEDLIQEAMSKGEFTNLVGTGKPLPNHQQQNPYVDFVTHKLNNILMDNGFTPEWIQLQKEIRYDLQELREDMTNERKTLGPLPLEANEAKRWKLMYTKFETRTLEINRKIDSFNLIVPILTKQLFRVQYDKIANDILKNGPVRTCNSDTAAKQSTKSKANDSLLSLIGSFF